MKPPQIKSKKNGKKKRLSNFVLFIIGFIFIFIFIYIIYKFKSKKPHNSLIDLGDNIDTQNNIFVCICSDIDDVDFAANCMIRLFETAHSPSRIFVGLCQVTKKTIKKESGWKCSWFTDLCKSKKLYSDNFLIENHIRVYQEPISECLGYSNAQYLIYKYLYRQEKYVVFLNPKIFLKENWDVYGIEELKRCLKLNPRSFWTQWENNYSGDEYLNYPTYPSFEGWNKYNMPCIATHYFTTEPVRPFLSLFYTSECSMMLKETYLKFPYDQQYYKMRHRDVDWIHSIRMWTNGYNFYNPTIKFIEKRYQFIEEEEKEVDEVFINKGYHKAFVFLGISPSTFDQWGEYGIGQERNIKQWKDYCGIDWNRKKYLFHSKVGMCLQSKSDKKIGKEMFKNEEVICKYGSWTKFYQITQYINESNSTYAFFVSSFSFFFFLFSFFVVFVFVFFFFFL